MPEMNPHQKAVVEITEGPLMIIAGPGSGKTFTLIERLFYLISEKGVTPESLFVATFTEKAASELITRLSNRLIEAGLQFNINEMYIGTIHSICLQILEDHRGNTRLSRNYTVMDEFDQQYFLYQNMWDYDAIEDIELVYGAGPKSRWSKSEALIKWINKISEENVDVARLEASKDNQLMALAACYRLYQKHLEENDALDFSTIQLEALRLLEKCPEVLSAIQKQVKYLMIDEYQDTNTLQEMILLKLAGKKANICVVGDDDQGLYRFRGATIRNILEFPTNFKKGKCHKKELTVNYRSHKGIISFYNNWMGSQEWSHEGRVFRHEKTVEPPKGARFPKKPAVFKVSGEIGEGNWHTEVLAFLLELKKTIVTDWNQVAFLFRSVKNPKVKSLSTYLEANGIPVYSPRSNMFFERPEVRLFLGAFLFIFKRYGEIRQWNENIKMSIWEYYDECLRAFGKELRKPENKDLLKWCQFRIKELDPMTKAVDYGFTAIFYRLLQFPLFNQYLSDRGPTGIIDGRPLRNIAIFSSLLAKFEYLNHLRVLTPDYYDKSLNFLFNNYLRFLKEGGINEFEDDSEYAPSGCVSFLTIHQSKGLEFPVVVVGSLEAVPRKQYTDLDERLETNYYRKAPFEPIEKTKYYDFWRLYYTAFSRAQNLLALSCQEAAGRGRTPSKYFADFYAPLDSWREIEFEGLTLEKIKDVNIKREYSFTSHVLLYENCARQYRFFKELAFSPVRQSPILFGILVHQTIEDVHKAALRGERTSITEENIQTWFNLNYQNLSKKERVYLAPHTQKVALEQVINYADRNNGNWDHIKEAEVEVALVKDKYILKGQVDLIQGKKGTVEIVDFKAEKKPNLTLERDRLDRYHRQLEIYAHIIEKRHGHKVSKMHLYYTGEKDGNPYVTYEKDGKHIKKTITVIDGIVEKIENKDYTVATRPDKHCADCDMKHYCDSI